jgi:hypothetical protein
LAESAIRLAVCPATSIRSRNSVLPSVVRGSGGTHGKAIGASGADDGSGGGRAAYAPNGKPTLRRSRLIRGGLGSANLSGVEGAGPPAISGSDVLWADSTAHRWRMIDDAHGATQAGSVLVWQIRTLPPGRAIRIRYQRRGSSHRHRWERRAAFLRRPR